jgi:hypothetical protein
MISKLVEWSDKCTYYSYKVVCVLTEESNSTVMSHNGTLKYNLTQCSQNKNVYHYINLKCKLLKFNANINFNKTHKWNFILSYNLCRYVYV